MSLDLLKSVTGRTLVESHRGSIGHAPENSWTAIKTGHQLGADLIEIDVQMSQDFVPFLRHNYQLPDGRWCNKLFWNELESILIEGEPLPRLDDVLVWARETGTKLSLDIKTTFDVEGKLTQEVVKTLERTNSKDIALLLFIDHNELFHIKKAYPEIKTRALLRGRLFNYAEYLQSIGADCASLSYGMFRPADIDNLHSVGISVVLGDLWNLKTGLFDNLDIDIFTHGDPIEARKILKYQ
jgi:glycerophosphoryl diester phosphodiesterase